MNAVFLLLISAAFIVSALGAPQQKVLIKVCSSTPTTSCNTNCSQYYALSDACWNSYSQMPGSNDSYVFQCHPVPQGCLDSQMFSGFGCNSTSLWSGMTPCHNCFSYTLSGQGRSTYTKCTNSTITSFVCNSDGNCGSCHAETTSKIGQCNNVIRNGMKLSMSVAATRRPCTIVKSLFYFNIGNCVEQYPQHNEFEDGRCNTVMNGANDNFDIALSCVAAGDVDASIPHISKLSDPGQMAALRRHVQGKGAAAAKKGF